MKKSLFALFLLPAGLMLCPADLTAQAKMSDVPYDFRRHELSLSYGIMPMGMLFDAYESPNPSKNPFTVGVGKVSDTYLYGTINLSYRYRFTPRYSVGLSLAFLGGNRRFEAGETSTIPDWQWKIRSIAILPMFRYNWRLRPRYSLYSAVGIGYKFERQYGSGHHANSSRFSAHLTLIGVEYGKRFVVFGEIGYGDINVYNIGLRWRFGHKSIHATYTQL
jgi:hypothetical protein